MMEDLGVDYIVHHTGYDERNGLAAPGRGRVSPLDAECSAGAILSAADDR
jgi:hypothetical protein